MPVERPAVPLWLRHALRAQAGPVPWSAMARGAAAVLPLLAAVLAGAPTAGVPAAIGALFAGINDRPGSRRTAVAAIGVPAVAGACGLLAGTLVGAGVPRDLEAWLLPVFLGLLGLFAGAISATGATASACGTQVLIAAVIGAGMDLPEPAWLRGLSYLTGAAWPLLLRRLVPGPRRRGPAPYRLDGEHAALAAVYERTAALLAAAGDAAAAALRTAFTAAVDHAQDVLARTRSGPRASRAERGLHARYGAAAALAEAATALAWTGEPVPERAVRGAERLAAAARTGSPCGPLPAPPRTAAGLRALDDALLRAAEAFDEAPPPTAPARGTTRAGGVASAPPARARATAGSREAGNRWRSSSWGTRGAAGADGGAGGGPEAGMLRRSGASSWGSRDAAGADGGAGGGGEAGTSRRPGAPSSVTGGRGDGGTDGSRDRAPSPGTRGTAGAHGPTGRAGGPVGAVVRRVAAVVRRAAGAAGREYGVRVGLCCAVSAALALVLGQQHWYWLPATAVFLVKPDLGPLASRAVCRALGTVVGAVLCAGLLATGPGPEATTATVAVCGALVPFATRHFAAQTAVVTVLVLCLVALAGEPPATGERVVQSLLACATVLVVGHLPLPGRHGNAVRHRLDVAGDAAGRYLDHVLTSPGDRAGRRLLRREAYRAAAAAQTAAGLSAAELPSIARHSAGAHHIASGLTGLLDSITACAVEADDRAAPVSRGDADHLNARLAELTRAT
ncbi:FUSC family protein [Streptomyces zhihengii]|uniref:FUSC family protein n=1 Tax=Streptomyces zhihengii TaxID=1818004 RepID=UPI00361674AF